MKNSTSYGLDTNQKNEIYPDLNKKNIIDVNKYIAQLNEVGKSESPQSPLIQQNTSPLEEQIQSPVELKKAPIVNKPLRSDINKPALKSNINEPTLNKEQIEFLATYLQQILEKQMEKQMDQIMQKVDQKLDNKLNQINNKINEKIDEAILTLPPNIPQTVSNIPPNIPPLMQDNTALQAEALQPPQQLQQPPLTDVIMPPIEETNIETTEETAAPKQIELQATDESTLQIETQIQQMLDKANEIKARIDSILQKPITISPESNPTPSTESPESELILSESENMLPEQPVIAPIQPPVQPYMPPPVPEQPIITQPITPEQPAIVQPKRNVSMNLGKQTTPIVESVSEEPQKPLIESVPSSAASMLSAAAAPQTSSIQSVAEQPSPINPNIPVEQIPEIAQPTQVKTPSIESTESTPSLEQEHPFATKKGLSVSPEINQQEIARGLHEAFRKKKNPSINEILNM